MSEEQEAVKWTAELEVALFHSMHRHKPVGEPMQLERALSLSRTFVARISSVKLAEWQLAPYSILGKG